MSQLDDARNHDCLHDTTGIQIYKIPITRKLIEHVVQPQGTYPLNASDVTYCQPPMPRPDHLYGEGMQNRYQILGCHEAFKPVTSWEVILILFSSHAFDRRDRQYERKPPRILS
ncbi:hypothetical protein EV363DRAFT_1180561 [Boletus edulis]|nr:hypothetical protein EV363DRAFT_1180561 [Boletus edulis]